MDSTGNNDLGSVPRKRSSLIEGMIPRKETPPSSSIASTKTRISLPDAAIPRKLKEAKLPSTEHVIPKNKKIERQSNPSSLDMASVPRKPKFGEAKASKEAGDIQAPASNVISKKKQKKVKKLSSSSEVKEEETHHQLQFVVTSEDPFLIQIPLLGVPLKRGITTQSKIQSTSEHHESSKHANALRNPPARTETKKRVNYKELQDTDDEEFLMDSDEEQQLALARKKKKSKKKLKRDSTTTSTAADASNENQASMEATPVDGEPAILMESSQVVVDTTSIDAPPPGTLNTLWYSHERFCNIWVMEKAISWRTRPSVRLEWLKENFPEGFEPTSTLPVVDKQEARRMVEAALTNPVIWYDARKRMEVSRIAPEACPLILTMAAAKEYRDTQGKPKFRLQEVSVEREEVYLIKWRGRSHLHASWERGSDIIKMDPSNNTARHKIRRFVQNQELSLGLEWKKVLEDERTTTAAIHSHGSVGTPDDDDNHQVEEYFPQDCAEVERILACDESEMDMSLFAKQRAQNIKTEEDKETIREAPRSQTDTWNSQEAVEKLLTPLPWDPEDNVRYVVKWKGLPFAEMTWEYWRDIKQEAVDETEDFWRRQQPPSDKVIEKTNLPHPHVREFKKLQESPEFGRSDFDRPILGNLPKDKEEDTEVKRGFKLREYQLEGVNWLLFNWFNKRSCILADGKFIPHTSTDFCFQIT
jgi:hypothetical protein